MSKYGTAQYGLNLYGSALEHPYVSTLGRVMWMIQVDWDRDGLFSGTIEPQAISKLHVVRGRGRRFRKDGLGQLQPGNERFEIEIIDPAGRYDSFNTSSPVYSALGAPGVMLRVMIVTTTGKATAQPVFVGTLAGADFDFKTGITTLHGSGLSRSLEIGEAASLYSPCQPGGVGGAVAGFDGYFKWDGSTPLPFNYWKGRPGGLPLRTCAALALSLAGWTMGLYYGSQVYNNEQPDYFYLQGESAWQTLKDLADAFAARLFFLRSGMLFVMDRLDPNGLAFGLAAPTRAQESIGLVRESPFETLRNRIEVKIRPQSVPLFKNPLDPSTLYSLIWTNAGPVEVPPNSFIDFIVKYPNVTGKPYQASFVSENRYALPYQYQAWSNPDKTGTNLGPTGSGLGNVWILSEAKWGGNIPYGNNQKYCTLHVENNSPTLTAYFFDLAVLAGGVYESGFALQKVIESPASIALNGLRVAEINSPWIQNATMAGNIGQAYLDALATREQASPASITYQWSGDQLYNNLMIYELGCHVDFGAAGSAGSLNNFGITGRWLIVGQEILWLSPDGQDALVKLTYEKTAILNVLSGNVTSTSGSAVSSLSWGHTIASGANRLLIVTIAKRDLGANVSGVTYGGAALALLKADAMGGPDNQRAEMWYLIAPAVGTANIVITLTGAEYIQAGGLDFTNVNQVSPFGVPVGAHGAAGPASAVVVSASGEMVVDVVCYRGADAGLGAGQTLTWSATSDGVWKGISSTEPGAVAVAMRWTIPAGGWAQVAAALHSSG
ncbi:MAG TPA: hypothetical protein VGK00_10335 [Anaerolineales bacterium]|jgi:hypothetical protein